MEPSCTMPAPRPGIFSVVTVNNCRIHFQHGGNGPPLFALHGGPGLDHTTLAGGMKQLERHFRVYYVDLRGHGKSERASREGYTFEQLAEDVEALRILLGHPRIVLVGHSMGAKIGLVYARKYAQTLHALVLVGANARPPRFAQKLLTARGRILARLSLLLWGCWGQLRTLLGVPWSPERGHALFWRHCWQLYAPRNVDSAHLREVLVNAVKPPLTALPELMNQLLTVDLSVTLPEISTPTLAVCGEEDALFREEQDQFLTIPDVECVTIPGAAHFPHLDQPAHFAREILVYLRRRCPHLQISLESEVDSESGGAWEETG